MEQKNKNKKVINHKLIFPILLGAVFCFGFLLAVSQADAAYQCSLNGTNYADQPTCTANCSQTANCNLNSLSASGSTGYAQGNSSLQASGNQICLWGDTDSSGNFSPYNAGCITLNGATASGSTGYAQGNSSLQASGNQICNWGDTDSSGNFSPYNAGCITLTPTTYSCPLSGGSACNASHQCTRPGTCTYIAPPTVNLTANPTSIIIGNSSTLSWSTSNATSCTASGGWTGSKSTSGSQSVAPTANATYTLTCTGPGGSASDSATVTVNAAAPTVSFSANPTTIIRGNSSTLSWSSTNATSCTASNGWSGAKSTGGTQSVAPSSTTIYTITCTGPGGTTSPASATVTVNSPAPTLTISASPSTINLGSSSTITWSSTDATSCTASVAWSGSKSTSGSQSVTPASSGSLNYVLQCSGPGGSTTKTATLTVNAPCNLPWGGTIAHNASVTAYQASSVACGSSCVSQTRTCNNGTLSGTYTNQNCSVATCPPTLTLTANPLTISSGGSSTLTWTVGGATTCTASNNQSYSNWTGSKSTAGGTQSVSPTTSTQFSMTCSNAGGSVTRSQTVNVNATPPTLTFTANPLTVTQGGSSVLTWTVQNATGCWGETADGDTNWPAGNRDFANGTHTQTVWPPKIPSTTYSLSCWNTGAGVDRTATVTVSAPASCALPWGGSIASGASVDAYQTSSVACGSTCTKQTRTCNNGILSGTYTNQNCTVNACNAPTLDFTGNPLSITAGDSSTLSWTVQNATSCWATTDKSVVDGWKDTNQPFSNGSHTFPVSPIVTTIYSLECWDSSSNSTGKIPATVVVNASPNPSLSVSVSTGGVVTSAPAGINCNQGAGTCSATFTLNSSVTLTAASLAGNHFVGWGGDCSGTNTTCNLTMNAAKTVSADFAPDCTPDTTCATTTCKGKVCSDGCGGTVDGTKVCSGAGGYEEVSP